MYSVYLVEEVKVPASSPKYSGTNNVNVYSSNEIQIWGATPGMSINVGDYIKFLDVVYPITESSLKSLSKFYSIKVDGVVPVGYYAGAAWTIYSSTIQTNHVKLDTDDIEFQTTFAVSDASDITKRPDTITKSITLKGTEQNNKAFGHLFHLNRNVDLKKSNKLFFNYSPLRTVDCLIYEDSVLIFRGNLMITEYSVKDIITYQATITGKRIDFNVAVGNSLMTDLDLTDLKHEFGILNIANSWGGALPSPSPGYSSVGFGKTQRYNPATDTYYDRTYEAGSGYVYPTIDYGEKFVNDTFNADYSWYKVQNYRPAVFVKEYYDRIFSKVGYSYEIKGSPDFIERFNHLIIPDSEEWLYSTENANPSRYLFSSPYASYPLSSSLALFGTQDHASNRIDDIEARTLYHPLRIPITFGTPKLTKYGPEFGVASRTNNIIQCTRRFVTDGYVRVKIRKLYNDSSTHDSQISVQCVKRAYSKDPSNVADWDILAQDSFTIAKKATVTEKVIEFLVPTTELQPGDQIMVRLTQSVGLTNIGSEYYPIYTIASCQFNISEVELRLPKNLYGNEFYQFEVMIGDKLIPKAPADMKQIDFIKSVHTILNAYVSVDTVNPKHFVIQSYDDFYALTGPALLKSNAINWTNKVDYSQGYKQKSNLIIPKSYTFTYREDSDYLNKTYQDKYGEAYGTLKFSDSLGVTESKKVEVIFAASPQVEIGNVKRAYPALTKDGVNLSQKKPMKTVPRILYHNGVRYCPEYSMNQNYQMPDGTWNVSTAIRLNWYCLASMYWYDKSTRNKDGVYINSYMPLHSLNFATPKEFYFNATGAYNSVPTLYSSYYINQITELTDANIATIECEVSLTEHEIGMLDLRVPVYIDTGSEGDGYFKVLSVEYTNNKRTSTVTLQRIV